MLGRHSEMDRQTGLSEGKLRLRFWPGTEVGENVSRRPVRPCFHDRPADFADAEPGDARVCRVAPLWTIAGQIREFGCGAAKQEVREKVYIGASSQEIIWAYSVDELNLF